MRSSKPVNWLFALVVGFRLLPTAWRRTRKRLFGKPNHFARSAPRAIPKKLWIFWDKGEENAPELVRDCIASWRRCNPGWDIRVLDAETAGQIADLPQGLSNIPVQAYADLLRLRLLRVQGGVWADATTYCLMPLDHWLPFAAQRGFFAFRWTQNDFWFIWPGLRRSMTNWFLAAEPEGTIITAWQEACFAYWDGRRKAHNYYWPHLVLDYLRLTSRSFRRALDDIPKVSCFGPHIVHDAVTQNMHLEEAEAHLRTGALPLQKLRWNWDEARIARARALLKAAEAQLPAPR